MCKVFNPQGLSEKLAKSDNGSFCLLDLVLFIFSAFLPPDPFLLSFKPLFE